MTVSPTGDPLSDLYLRQFLGVKFVPKKMSRNFFHRQVEFNTKFLSSVVGPENLVSSIVNVNKRRRTTVSYSVYTSPKKLKEKFNVPNPFEDLLGFTSSIKYISHKKNLKTPLYIPTSDTNLMAARQDNNLSKFLKFFGNKKNIPIYDIEELQNIFQNDALKNDLMAEWAWVLRESSGVIVLRNAYRDTSVIDEATQLYEGIIADEKLKSGGGADHFAAAGANDRIWNSLQKLCEFLTRNV